MIEPTQAGADTPKTPAIRYRFPTPADGRAVHRLVREAGGLELNTEYAYLLLCDHFASTTIIAETEGRVVGFVAAYVPPSAPDTVFVWQIAVHPDARSRGIARALLHFLVARPACAAVSYLEATVTPENEASRRLFESFATQHETDLVWSDGYPARLFAAAHEPERLVRIGPLARDPSSIS